MTTRDRTSGLRRPALALLAAMFLLWSCGGGDTAPDPPAPMEPTLTSITLSPADVPLGVGLARTLAAQAYDQNGAPMRDVDLTWTSSNAAVAGVAQGIVSGVTVGTSTITAASGGIRSNPVTVTVVAGAASRVVIDKASVFLPANGQLAQLSAQVLDAGGAPLPGSVSWESSAPDKVSVDAAGRVQALAIGSAQIFARAGGVRSAPTLAIVAEPKPGALLVNDAQVLSVGSAIGLAPNTPAGVGTRYEVTLQGVKVPAVGSVVLAAESAPVAGRVVSTRQDAAGLVVTLALAPLHELFGAYDIKFDIALSAFEFEPVPDRAAIASQRTVWANGRATRLQARTAARPLDVFEPFSAWKCDGDIKPHLLSAPISLSFDNQLRLVLEDRPGYTKHALEGSAEIVGNAGFKLKANFNASGRCNAQGQVRLPVFGWLSALVMPAVRFGLGAELEGAITLVQGELSVDGRIGVAPSLGWECGGASPQCRGLDRFEVTDNFKTTSKIPSDDDMEVKVSAHIYAVGGLDASLFFGALNAGIVEARIGPKQSFELAFEEDQASRQDFAAGYDLKIAGVIEPGPALAKAIEKVIGDDSTTVSFKGEFSKDISESPKGTLSVSKPLVAPGKTVDFTVELAPPSSLQYWLLGYNVKGVQLWRRAEGQTKFEFWKAMDQIATNRATYRWTPSEADAGKYEVAAFVDTQIDVPWLEVARNSVQQIEVSCFSDTTLTALAGRARPQAGAQPARESRQALVCADAFVGSLSGRVDNADMWHEVSSVDLRFDRIESPVPDGSVTYRPSGTVQVRAKPGADCDEGQATTRDVTGELKVFNEGPLAGTYQLVLASTPSITFQCGTPRRAVTFDMFPGGIAVGGNDLCPTPRVGDDGSVLSGSWFCRPTEISTVRANWNLRRP